MMDPIGRAAHLLGSTGTFYKGWMSPQDWICAIRRGFPTSVLDTLGRNLNASNAELAQMLGISVRALAWRRNKGTLTSSESERLFRVVKMIVRAEEVFGGLVTGIAWLKAQNISLGGISPISLLDTDTGAELVMDALGRIEHGIFA